MNFYPNNYNINKIMTEIFYSKAKDLPSLIDKLDRIRPGQFDLSNAFYVNSHTSLMVKCLRCNNPEFSIKPSRLTSIETKELCSFCRNIESENKLNGIVKALDKTTFIQKLEIDRPGHYYVPETSEYKGNNENITIVCIQCEEYVIAKPINLFDLCIKENCSGCRAKKIKEDKMGIDIINTDTFKEKLEIKYLNYYDSSKSVFTNMDESIELKCLRCNNIPFNVIPNELFSKEHNDQCTHCVKESKIVVKNTEQLRRKIEIIKPGRYDTSKTVHAKIIKGQPEPTVIFTCLKCNIEQECSIIAIKDIRAKEVCKSEGCRLRSPKITIEDMQKLANLNGHKYEGLDVPLSSHWVHGPYICKYGHIFKVSYHNMKHRGDGCTTCNGSPIKLHEDYLENAKLKGWKYLSEKEDLPLNTKTIGGIYECSNEHITVDATYEYIRDGHGCKKCIGNLRLTLEDYKIVQGDKGVCILTEKPVSNNISVSGWICNHCGKIYTACYASIYSGSWCFCTFYNEITLAQYYDVCEDKGKCILDEKPKTTSICVDGWLCFTCKKIYNSSYQNIKNGSWCYCVKNKTELKVYTELIKYYPDIQKQYKPDWLINPYTGYNLSLDFYLGRSYKYLCIEIDGSFHFKNVERFNSSGDTIRYRDLYKVKKAIDNKHFIIRISQEDIWKSSPEFDWLTILRNQIDIILKSRIPFDSQKIDKKIIYISLIKPQKIVSISNSSSNIDDVYKKHREEFNNYNDYIEQIKIALSKKVIISNEENMYNEETKIINDIEILDIIKPLSFFNMKL
jgi:hypothetical protein